MTEQEWFQGRDVVRMIEFVGNRVAERKLRLFCVACCSRVWDKLTDPRSFQGALTLAAYADGKATAQELHEAWRQAAAAAVDDGPNACEVVQLKWTLWEPDPASDMAPARLVANATRCSAREAAAACATAPLRGWRHYTARVLQDLFGNPFRTVAIAAECLTDTVRAMARQIYDDGNWHEMAALGNALREAGCRDEEVLRHCRDRMRHGRGCWVVDLLTGRA